MHKIGAGLGTLVSLGIPAALVYANIKAMNSARSKVDPAYAWGKKLEGLTDQEVEYRKTHPIDIHRPGVNYFMKDKGHGTQGYMGVE